MPYIGTPPSDRIITSEDIEAGAVEMSDISWKNQQANENISGTIDSFTVKLAEQFTLTGDIDISKDLVLTKLADDGEALVLTTDASSRTIEGSGTISSNTFAQVPNASVTGMTGVLDNSVQDNITRLGTVTSGTIASGTIGSAVTFPTGTIRFIDTKEIMSAAGSVNSASWLETDDAGSNPRLSLDIAQSTIDLYSKIIVEASFTIFISSGSSFTFAEFRFVRGDYGASNGTAYWSDRGSYFGRGTSSGHFLTHVNMHIVDESLPTSNGAEYYIQFRPHHGNSSTYAGGIAPLGAETDLGARITAWGVI